VADIREHNTERELLLRVFGADEDAGYVDAGVLAQALQGLQKAVYVLALQREHRELRDRGRYPDDIARRFVLRCSLPRPGSYAMPMTLGGFQSEVDDAEAIPAIVKNIIFGMDAIAAESLERLKQILPERRYRLRFLEAARNIAPGAGRPYKVGISNGTGVETVLSGKSPGVIREFVQSGEQETSFQTVTGELHRIHFEENKVFILYPVTQRLLECSYDPDIEEMLLEQRRDWVQVTGTVVLDDDDEPKRIIDVVSICDLDTSPITLQEVPFRGGALRFGSALELRPEMTEFRQLLFLEHEPLGINVHAPTRDELVEEVYEQIRMLWIEYATENDEHLSPPALALKTRLLNHITETADGA
jgi:hypothetical protein